MSWHEIGEALIEKARFFVLVLASVFLDVLFLVIWLWLQHGAYSLSSGAHVLHGAEGVSRMLFEWCFALGTFIPIFIFVADDTLKIVKRLLVRVAGASNGTK